MRKLDKVHLPLSDTKVDLESNFQSEFKRLYDEWQKWGEMNWDKSQKIGNDKLYTLQETYDKFGKQTQLELDQPYKNNKKRGVVPLFII
ncbi:hypothetical protein [Shimazuella soli]|uniref:hypothetical protein n=1 Tax=Shimazuella soli TaxID=1892854 RepID=UPI001F10CC2C|nr:hypothetical protein [Shimazuella soli]